MFSCCLARPVQALRNFKLSGSAIRLPREFPCGYLRRCCGVCSTIGRNGPTGFAARSVMCCCLAPCSKSARRFIRTSGSEHSPQHPSFSLSLCEARMQENSKNVRFAESARRDPDSNSGSAVSHTSTRFGPDVFNRLRCKLLPHVRSHDEDRALCHGAHCGNLK